MRKQFIIILLALLAVFGLMVSCKNEVTNAGFGEELVSVSFKEDTARGLTASIESFDKQDYYWAYAAQKADGSHLISGQTANYGEPNETRVWIKTDSYNNPVIGLGTTGSTGYEAYKVPGFSQGYWNFKLYAYKRSGSGTTQDPYTYQLVYQGETLSVLLKSDSVNTQGSHLVSVIVDPVQSQDNGTMVFLTNKSHLPADRISMNTVNSATYGTDYTVKVLSILSIEDFPVEYVDAAGAKIHEATDSQDGEYTLPAGSYKVTVAFTDSASAPTLNYARGTIVATVYSNLATTISGDLTEAMTYAEFDGILNPDLVTVTASSGEITYNALTPSTQVSFSSSGSAKAVTATTTKAVTNQIIQEIAATNGTNTTEYNQSLVLTLNVETVEATATTATYEIGMSAELTSTKVGDPTDVTKTTSDVSSVNNYVTIELQLKTGLTIVSVLHSGEAMTESPTLNPAADTGTGIFTYNQATGVLTLMTKSFSPFDIAYIAPADTDYVAQVGNLKFLTLADAIAKAASNSTVTLLKSITTDAVFNVVNGRLDLAGYAINGNVTASENGAIIKNGSITGTLTAGGNSAQLQDLTVTGKISIGGTGAVLENCTVTGTGDYAVKVIEGNATIKSGTYKAATEGKILYGAILVEDGNFKGALTESASVSLIGGVYEQNVGTYVAEGYECAKVSEGVYKVRKIIEARNVTTETDYYFLQDAIDAASAGDEIQLLRNVTADITVAVDKSIILNFGTFELSGNPSSSNAPALTNAGTLVLRGAGTYAEKAIVKANIRNDHVAISNTGTLTVESGTYLNEGAGGVFVNRCGNMTIGSENGLNTDVVLQRTGTAVGGYMIQTYGTSVESRGTTVVNAITMYGDKCNGALYSCDYADLTVKNADIDVVCPYYLIYVEEGSTTVNGGTFKVTRPSNDGQQLICIWDEETPSVLSINGGTFVFDNPTGTKTPEYIVNNTNVVLDSNPTVNITGGLFTKTSDAYTTPTRLYFDHQSKGLDVNLSGGRFKTQDFNFGTTTQYPAYNLPDGYVVLFDSEAGLYYIHEVTEDEAVAKIVRNAKPVYFLTIEDAFDAAVSNETIVLVKDADITSMIAIADNCTLTLNLNGNTLTDKVDSAVAGNTVEVDYVTDYSTSPSSDKYDKRSSAFVLRDASSFTINGEGTVILDDTIPSDPDTARDFVLVFGDNTTIAMNSLSLNGNTKAAVISYTNSKGKQTSSTYYGAIIKEYDSNPIIVLNNVTTTTNNAFVHFGGTSNTCNITVNGGVYSNQNRELFYFDVYAVDSENSPCVFTNVTANAIDNPVIEASGGYTTINGCTFTVSYISKTSLQYVSPIVAEYDAVMIVDNSTFTSGQYVASVMNTGGYIYLNSGTFGSTKSLYVSNSKNSAVLRIFINGGDYYYTDDDAFFDGGAGDISCIIVPGLVDDEPNSATFSTTLEGTVVKIDEGYETTPIPNTDPQRWGITPVYWIDLAADSFDGGSGTEQDPYLVSSPTQLARIAKLINVANSEYTGKYYKLTANIDLSGKIWTPIGYENGAFAGTIDGNGMKITGLSNHTENTSLTNLADDNNHAYGFVGVAALSKGNVVVKDLTFESVDIDVTGGKGTGTVVGYLLNEAGVSTQMIISNVIVGSGSVVSNGHSGGIVGKNYGLTATIDGCTNSASVSGGNASGIVNYCSNASQTVTVNNCRNYGAVTANGGGSYASGIANLVNFSSATVSNCVNTGEVKDTSTTISNIGGVIATGNTGTLTIYNLENNGKVSAPNITTSYKGGVGGIIGYVMGTLTIKAGYLKNSGEIDGLTVAGGIFGLTGNGKVITIDLSNETEEAKQKVEFFNEGDITVSGVGTTSSVNHPYGAGAIIGYLGSNSSTFTKCYFKNLSGATVDAPTGSHTGLIAGSVGNLGYTFDACTYSNEGTITELSSNMDLTEYHLSTLPSDANASRIFGFIPNDTGTTSFIN